MHCHGNALWCEGKYCYSKPEELWECIESINNKALLSYHIINSTDLKIKALYDKKLTPFSYVIYNGIRVMRKLLY